MWQNDAFSLVILFFAVVAVWGAGALTVWLLVRGGTRGSHPTPHRDGAERTESGRGLPVRLHPHP